MTAGPSADGGLLISLSDTGVGFDMGKLEEIFKPFHRLEPNKFYGLGLGLCLVKDMTARIVRSSIEIDSLPGKGTNVKLVLAEGTAVEGAVLEIPVSAAVVTPVPALEPQEAAPAEPTQTAAQPVAPPAETQPVEKTVERVAAPADQPAKVEESAPAVQAPVVEKVKPQPVPEAPAKVVIVEPVKAEVTEVPKVAEPETLQFNFADMPKDEEDQETVKRKTLAGDKYRILVEMDDGSEPPSIQSALSNLSLAVEILKERIAVANATSSNIKALIKQIDTKY
jgi:hypothetical protein